MSAVFEGDEMTFMYAGTVLPDAKIVSSLTTDTASSIVSTNLSIPTITIWVSSIDTKLMLPSLCTVKIDPSSAATELAPVIPILHLESFKDHIFLYYIENSLVVRV